MKTTLRIGYIPLIDAAPVLIAADHGFAESEGLSIDLVREVSWSNVRDKLNLGLFDAAHMLAPLPIASSLGIGHVEVPLIVPFTLALNGNAITVSPSLFAELAAAADGDIVDPQVSARALHRVVADRRRRGAPLLNFGMTFPFSNHNYQLRLWMAAGGVDPDEDVRLVVLPPPYMVDSLTSGHVDCFCVGAPWNSVAVDNGIGHILHFSTDIVRRMSEKVLAVRRNWAGDNPETLSALIRALAKAAAYAEDPDHRAAVCDTIGKRIGATAEVVSRTLKGVLKTTTEGETRSSDDYILLERTGANRPDRAHAAWMYADMVRWRQTPLSSELQTIAENVFRPDLYDAALGHPSAVEIANPPDRIGAFFGPDFAASDIGGYLESGRSRHSGRPRLTLVR
ncbi:MAG: ABC transporter substrate-binding protein [Pseudolabrys sp.]|nr:ABC transporter substrate-binding protein [Pseudolabrys sp.]